VKGIFAEPKKDALFLDDQQVLGFGAGLQQGGLLMGFLCPQGVSFGLLLIHPDTTITVRSAVIAASGVDDVTV